MSIKVLGVSKLYGQQKALDQVSFEINSGEIVGFLGPNGAGKSTMMKIITGFIPQTSGQVFVNDQIVDAEAIDIRQQIGYLPEHNPLYLDMYVREYLRFIGGLYRIDKIKDRVEEMIELTGLQIESSKKIGALSKGYRQRVGLAQALIHDPSVLILDEPTSGLDPNQIVEIRDLIARVGLKKTVMLSTHIMQEVEAICGRIIIINKGQIVAEESTQNASNILHSTEIITQIELSKTINSSVFKQIKGINEAQNIKDQIWVIRSQMDVRQQIFDLAIKENFSILSMQLVEKTLEQIFQEVTQKK
jgi:ABC-2 type transport system ATP-binding protein